MTAAEVRKGREAWIERIRQDVNAAIEAHWERILDQLQEKACLTPGDRIQLALMLAVGHE